MAAADAPLPEPVDDGRRGRRADRRRWPARPPGREVLEPYVADRWRLAELTVSYRTPAEIMAVAAEVLADIDPYARTAAGRCGDTGVEPWDVTGRPDRLAEPGRGRAARPARSATGRLGVIVPAGRVAELAPVLADAAARRRRPASSRSWSSRVVVLTVRQAKGLEFDARRRGRPGRHRGRVAARAQRPLRRADPGHPAPRRVPPE